MGKSSHFVASLYRPPGWDIEKLELQLASFESQLEKIKDIHKSKRKAMNRNWYNQKANPAFNTKAGNK